jgi:hypothetical protein
MSNQSDYEDDLCQRFIENPNVNPIDGKRLLYGKGPYIGFVALCKIYNYNVDHLLSPELTAQHAGSRSPSRSRSPPRSPYRIRTPVRTVPLRSTESVEITPISPPISPVRTVPLLPTPIEQTRSLSVRSSPPLSVPVVRGPSIQGQYSERRESIGRETFDPDPVTTVTRIPSSPVHTTVQGPYGPRGQDAVVSGVYTPPDRLQYTTYDYPEHEIARGSNRTVINNSPIRPVYNSRTVTVGNEQFDPDPTTQVVEQPGISVREDAFGPYGPNGEYVRVSGVHTLPGQRRYITTDIPNHTVRTNTVPSSTNRTYSTDIY